MSMSSSTNAGFKSTNAKNTTVSGGASASTSEELAAPAVTKEKVVSINTTKPVVILVGRPETTEQDKAMDDVAPLVASESGTTSESPTNDDEKEDPASVSKDESKPNVQISCSRCHVVKGAKAYNNEERARGIKGNKARCSTCVAFRNMLKRKFNLTLAEFDVKSGTQGGRCGACKTESILDKHKIDFCETTKTFRGIVCDKCFARIKALPEPLTVDGIIDMLVYLVKNSKEVPASEATAKILTVCEAFGVLVTLPK
jgi:hypothetical protein